jgi:protein TonB
MKRLGLVGLAVVVGCSGGDVRDTAAPPDEERRGFEAPVLTNPESPVRYPPDLYRNAVEGTVILRLFADSTGRLVPDSTRIAEGSGYPGLDSAALTAASELRFAPARRNGRPVATTFLQPVRFQRPDRATDGGGQ